MFVDDAPLRFAKARMASTLAMVMALVFILLKAFLYWRTDAASFLASLLDSGMDLGLSGVMWFGLKWAEKPADSNHRYGHGKIEALVGFLQALVVGIAALALAWQAGLRFQNPVPLKADSLDIGLSVFIVLGTLALVMFQTQVIKETGSVAVKGDRAHYTGDLWSSAALLGLLFINGWHPVPWLDPLLSLCIACGLLFMASEVGKGAVNILLDHEVEDEIRLALLQAAQAVEGVLNVHDLRAIESGGRLHVSLDIEVSRSLGLVEAHDIAISVEKAMLGVAPLAEIMVHVDPEGELEDSRHTQLEPHHYA